MQHAPQVIGQMTSSVTEVLNFMQISETLWASSALSDSSQIGRQNGSRLVGEHSWPFSLTLPSVCQVRLPNATMETFSLPASFSERLARVHIQYQVIATVHRSRFRVDSRHVFCYGSGLIFPRSYVLTLTTASAQSSDTFP